LRRIIVNADDFGLTPGVNRGIYEAATLGIVSSTSFIANSLGFAEAVQIASAGSSCNSHRRLGIGCHIVLLDGRPVLPANDVPSLLSAEDRTVFRPGFMEFGLSAIRGKLSPAEIEAESIAQIRKIQASGVKLSHVDTHKHSHLFPAVMRPVIRAAKACGIRSIRNPFYPNRFPGVRAVRNSPNLAKRYFQIPLLRRFEKEFQRLAGEEGMRTTDGCIGVYEPALSNIETLRNVLRRVPDGTWELVCHPGYVDQTLDSVKTRLRESRVRELELLTSKATSELLDSEGIIQISYQDL
jgi:predicted glycoside hydrolase/deacetylase ChbG (UPF0249 family)